MPRGRSQRRRRIPTPGKAPAKTARAKGINWAKMQARGLEAIKNKFIPKVETPEAERRKGNDFNAPGWCSAYATRAAQIIFGLDYVKIHTWLLSRENSLVLGLLKKSPGGKFLVPKATKLSQFENVLRPGRLIGVYFDWSPSKERAAMEGKPYTHAMLYLGKHKGKHWVLHNVGGRRLETLENALRAGQGNGIVVEIIQPKKK